MCLYTYGKKHIAKRNIKVYKILIKNLHSPIYDYAYQLNTPNPTIPLELEASKEEVNNRRLFVTHQGYHAYTNMKTVKTAFRKGYCKYGLIVECIIPKNAIYYKGEKHNSHNEIVSSNIIIKKVIK